MGYVAPRYMTAQAWDILAEGLQWARRHASILLDSHWSFGDPTERQVYCVSSWSIEALHGFVFLHNPTGFAQVTQEFGMSDVLELPRAQEGIELSVEILKSIARSMLDANGTAVTRSIINWKCDALERGVPGVCPLL